MILIFKGKFVDVIQFRTVQWRLRLILDYIYRVRIFFHQPLTVNIVIASVLQGKTLTVSLFGIYNLLKIGQTQRILVHIGAAAFIASSSDPADIADVDA